MQPATESSAAGCMPPSPGRVTSSTPRKPTPIAASRRGPGHSPSRGPDTSATISGVANAIEIVSASWR